MGDFQALAEKNEGMRYLLLGVDVLSRQMFGVPTKSKSTSDMKNAFENVFAQFPFLPQKIFTDR